MTANASDNGSVAGVQFKLDGANLGAEDTTSPYSVSWDTFSAPNGAHTLSAVARDGAGNTTTSAAVPVTVSNTGGVGLVGAWAFDEGTGTAAADQSGRGNNGTIANAAWVTNGKFNKALSFNGTSAWVTVADAATLDLTTGMTLEAWVRPAVPGGWRTAVAKDQAGGLAYGLYSSTNAGFPGTEASIAGSSRSLDAHATAPRRRLEPRRVDLRRDDAAPLRQRQPGRPARRRRLDRDVCFGAPHRRQRRLGRVVQRHDRRGARLQPGARRERDPERHAAEHHAGRDRAHDQRADPVPRLGRRERGHLRNRHVQRVHERRQHHDVDVPAQGLEQRRRPRDGHARRRDEHCDADAERSADVRRDLHGHRQGRREWREGLRRQPARRRLDVVVHRRSLPAADPRRRLDHEPVRLVPPRDPPQRRAQRLHDDRRRLRLAGAARAVRRRRARGHAAEPRAGERR